MAGRKARPKVEISGISQPKIPETVVLLDGGLMHRGSLSRIKEGVERIPDIHALVAEDAPSWGPGWNGDEVRKVIVHMVGEGSSISKAIAALSHSYPGRVPSMTRVYTWLREMPDFAAEMDAAHEMRGDLMGDASVEVALDLPVVPTKEEVSAAKIKSEALRWGASKFSARRFGDNAKVDVVHSLRVIPDAELDRRIAMLMSDPDLKTLGNKVQDAEILDPEDSQSES